MIPEVVQAWREDDESRCPHCGGRYMWMREEEDDGYDKTGHWVEWECKCTGCGGKWYVRWYLTGGEVYGEDAQ